MTVRSVMFGQIKIASITNGFWDVMFFPERELFGGPIRAHRIYGEENLVRFTVRIGCKLSVAQLQDIQEGRSVRGTPETFYASVASVDHKRFFA